MKAETTMGSLRRLAIAWLIGMLAQHALASRCFAQDDAGKASDAQLTAAMPEAGTPPAPVASSKSEASRPPTNTPVLPGEATTEPSSGQPAADEPATDQATVDQATAPAIATEAIVAEAESIGPSVVRSEGEVRELSVSPESKPLLPAGRPTWVGAPPDLSNPRRHRLFVGSFPTSSIDEADAALDEPMLAAVLGYIDEQVLEGRGADELNITAHFIRRNLLDPSTEYLAELSTSSGPVYQKWVVLEITPEHRKYFIEAYRQVEQKQRMVAIGLGLAGLLGITGVAHLAFNRRRRRYDHPVQPVVHTLMNEPEPVASKHSGRIVWLIAGCLGCLAFPFLVVALFLFADETQKVRTTGSTTIHIGPRAMIHGEAPVPPAPPQPPEVYIERTGMQQKSGASRERRRRLQAAWEPIEMHEQVIEVQGEGD